MKTRSVLKVSVLAFAVGSMFWASQASAYVTIYTDLAAWQAAAGFTVTEPFNAGSLEPVTAVSTTAGSIAPASGVLSGSVWRDDMYNNPSYYSSTIFSYRPGQLMGAAAVWDTSPNGDGLGVNIDLNGGSERIYHIGGIHGGFVGWVSSTPFNNFMLSCDFRQFGGGETFEIDNLQFAPAPEPGVGAILALGIIGVGLGRRLVGQKLKY